MQRFIYFITAILFFCNSNASSVTLVLNNKIDSYDLSKFLSFFTDTTGRMNLSDLSDMQNQKNFVPLKGNIFQHNPSPYIFWMKAEITDQAVHYPWYLYIDYAPVDHLTVFLQDQYGQTDIIFTGGNNHPANYFLQDHTAIKCKLPLEKNRHYTIFFRIETNAYLLFPAKIATPEYILQHSNTRTGILYFLFGILLSTLLFNMILYLLIKEKIYLQLSLVILLMGAGALIQFGIELFPFLNFLKILQMRLIIFGLIMLTANIFIAYYLEIARFRFFPKIFNVINILLGVYILLNVFRLIPDHQLSLITPFISLMIILFYSIAGIFSYVNKVRSSRYFLLYIVIFLISSLIWLLMLNNIIPLNNLTKYVHLISFSLISLVFTLGLSDKVTAIKSEREKTALLQSFNLTLKQEIEERKQTESALRESEKKLRELNATKDKFFSIIGHDLMNPFNALLGFSNLLSDTLKKEDYQNSTEFAGYIAQSAEQISQLLHNLLVWAKSQNNNIMFNPVKSRIADVTAETLLLLLPNIQNKQIGVQQEIDKKAVAEFDTQMISTVIRNLLANAIKFSNPGGTIRLKGYIKDTKLHFTVSDNGVGMDVRQLSELFDLQKSFTSRGTRNESGTGLGLVICREYIERHKGRIWAESTPGKGSDFHFTIPV